MNRSELIAVLAARLTELHPGDIELSTKLLLEAMSQTLVKGERIEVRGFGSFSLVYRPPRLGRNPMTGASVQVPAKYRPHFKPGTQLRLQVEAAARTTEADVALDETGER